MFSHDQAQAFHQEGFVRIAGAVPQDAIHPFVQGRRITGLNMFLFVDHVKPRGGGTAVRSSPQVNRRSMSEAVPRAAVSSSADSYLQSAAPTLRGRRVDLGLRLGRANRPC